MAIIFEKGLPLSGGSCKENYFFNSYNNRIIKFYSDEIEDDAYYADIRGAKIYPNINGVFEFNLKDLFIREIKNVTNNLIDDELIEIGIKMSNFAGSQGILLGIYIYDQNGNSDGVVLNWIMNLPKVAEDLSPIQMQLTEVMPLSFVGNKITRFIGYPFDFTIGGCNFTVNDNRDKVIGSLGYLERFFLSDGKNEIPSYGAFHFLDINDEKKLRIDIKEVDCDGGVYLKWFSIQTGSFKYWLFSKKKKVTQNVKEIGFYLNDFLDDNTNSNKMMSLGKKESRKNTQLYAIGMEDYERLYLADIINSPRVWLYMGEQNDVGTIEMFKQIKVVDNSFVTEEANKNKYKISIQIEELQNDAY